MTPEEHYRAAEALIAELAEAVDDDISGRKVAWLHLRAAEVGNQMPHLAVPQRFATLDQTIRDVHPSPDELKAPPVPRRLFGFTAPEHVQSMLRTNQSGGVLDMQCEHGHAEGMPTRVIDAPKDRDPRILDFLRAHAHGFAIMYLPDLYGPPEPIPDDRNRGVWATATHVLEMVNTGTAGLHGARCRCGEWEDMHVQVAELATRWFTHAVSVSA